MKYVGDLITEIRRDTRNQDVPTTDSDVGISTEDFLRYINFAQEKCQAIAISAKSTKFNTPEEISLVADTSEYEISDRVYLDEHILNVEYSNSGLARDYYELREQTISQRSDSPGSPAFYIRRGGSIILCPVYNSSGAKVRVTYDRAVDTLDIRRGQIASRTDSGTQVSAIVLDTTSDDPEALESAQFICVNDAYGAVTMYNIPVTAYNSSTGALTLRTSPHTYASGETAAVGAYVTVGEYTTTHCKLNHLCEKYLAQYAAYKIFGRDSSKDLVAMRDDMKDALKDIMTSYQEAPRDEASISIDNPELMVGVW